MLYQAYFWLKNFLGTLRQEEGQGLVEYALILVLIAIVVIVVLRAVGVEVTGVFEDIVTALSGATTP
ncbi:MAG: Flp family type IVb pilin [Anaerolineaceae bacterium]